MLDIRRHTGQRQHEGRQFEQRLRSVIRRGAGPPGPDHPLHRQRRIRWSGAGGAAGTGDAANLLKPALARGSTIGRDHLGPNEQLF